MPIAVDATRATEMQHRGHKIDAETAPSRQRVLLDLSREVVSDSVTTMLAGSGGREAPRERRKRSKGYERPDEHRLDEGANGPRGDPLPRGADARRRRLRTPGDSDGVGIRRCRAVRARSRTTAIAHRRGQDDGPATNARRQRHGRSTDGYSDHVTN